MFGATLRGLQDCANPMGKVITFPSLVRREPAVIVQTGSAELIAMGRNDLATVIETVCLLRDSGRDDLLDEFNRGTSRRGRRRGIAS